MGTEIWKILIVDDERQNLEILYNILKSADDYASSGQTEYRVTVAKSGRAALEKIEADKPDLILLDVLMPGMNGFETLAELNRNDDTRHIPVIFITGLDSVADEEKGLQMGAVDYITKPFHKAIIKARIKTHLRIVGQMRIIEQLSLIDPLTGIPNRRSFDNQLASEWARAARVDSVLSLLMLDIDHFKRFNDLYGHQQGDVVLKTVANAVRNTARRPGDFVVRWGGEEFAVLLTGTGMEGALVVAEEIRSNIELTTVPGISRTERLGVTISIGVSSATPSAGITVTEFVQQADKALYMAKARGRNRVCTFTGGPNHEPAGAIRHRGKTHSRHSSGGRAQREFSRTHKRGAQVCHFRRQRKLKRVLHRFGHTQRRHSASSFPRRRPGRNNSADRTHEA